MTSAVTPTRTRGGSAVLNVGVGIALSSLMGLTLLALIARMLPKSDNALFLSFWGVMFGLASSLALIEQEAARQSTLDDTQGETPIRQVATAAALIAGVAAALTLAPPVAALVYGDSDSRLGVLIVAAVLGFAMQFMIRGLLIGSGQIKDYSLLVIAEAAVRLVALAVVWFTVGATLGTVAAAATCGAFAWLLWARHARQITDPATVVVPDRRRSWRRSFTRALPLMVLAGLTASLITGFPTMVTVFAGGQAGDEGSSIFNALTAARVPLLFVAPLQALAVPAVVRWRRRETTTSASAHQIITRALLATAAVATVAAAGAWFVGPWGVQLVFGPKHVVTSVAVAGLVFSACLLALLQLMSAALIAFESYRTMGLVWATAVATTVAWLLLSPYGVVASTVIGALVGPVAGVTVATVLLWRLTADHDPLPRIEAGDA